MAIQDLLPKSRITLTYRTTINGEQETVNLPLRLLVMGDFSLGSSEDRKNDLETRRLRSIDGKNLDELMKDMKMSASFQVPNRINPDVESELNVQLPVDGMKSFHPDEVVKHVPKLKALLLLKTLLVEMQSNIDNRKDLRRELYELFSKPEALKELLNELKGYESMRLPSGETAAKPDASAAAAPAAGKPTGAAAATAAVAATVAAGAKPPAAS
ncbi:type VI secretion system contractile sheath small subunit [Corallococcus praedator]|uniref:Type VI secretion system contractile sheath small subunit n=1 Tax=Corallococcus praedator TaxID=2316724 RepID=A0ABX9QG57_9BACT|nr:MULTISPECIES: type VI secretion system contractile sheath small subunit [Corallococcus]RKH11390.1 type VI secretion system contractile sheath small subunit [Corallococcus sp. CA047B]RKH28616.1 type VI secretion system contractile sheath small subunit [Corallococcus sp. CA031C]RKI06262.1 type VI secretion system contractile sheath small subunit [Corallococcus praedator]